MNRVTPSHMNVLVGNRKMPRNQAYDTMPTCSSPADVDSCVGEKKEKTFQLQHIPNSMLDILILIDSKGPLS